jgi:hypothetical protein
MLTLMVWVVDDPTPYAKTNHASNKAHHATTINECSENSNLIKMCARKRFCVPHRDVEDRDSKLRLDGKGTLEESLVFGPATRCPRKVEPRCPVKFVT